MCATVGVWWVDSGWTPGAHLSHSVILLSLMGQRGHNGRLMGQDKDTERSLSYCCHGQNSLDWGKLLPVKYRVMRNKPRSYNKHFPFTPPFFLGSTSKSTSFLPVEQGLGNEGCSPIITHCLCCSFLLRGRAPHSLALLQCGVPLMGDTHPALPPTWVLSLGCGLSSAAPECIPCGVTEFEKCFWNEILAWSGRPF